MKMIRKLTRLVPVFLLLILLIGTSVNAAGTMETIVDNLFGDDTNAVDIMILLTLLSLLPSILIMMTCFTRIIIVVGFMRSAMGTQQTPPNQVLIGLALFLTLFIMWPVFGEIYDTAYVPYSEGQMEQDEFIDTAMVPLRNFMLRQTYKDDLNFFISMSGEELASYEETPSRVLIPSFMVSEIKRAFQIGFFIYIPFIVIDMVVASTLMSMGMMMLPPAMISMPFKILMFVMVDGWQLVIGTLVQSFGGG